jgi:hypothetical protein
MNLCHLADCPNLCCENMWFCMIPKQERAWTFPNAEKVSEDTEVDQRPRGVYITQQFGEFETIFLRGPCEHETPSGCDGKQLTKCRTFPFGGVLCDEYRRAHGLPPVSEYDLEMG